MDTMYNSEKVSTEEDATKKQGLVNEKKETQPEQNEPGKWVILTIFIVMFFGFIFYGIFSKNKNETSNQTTEVNAFPTDIQPTKIISKQKYLEDMLEYEGQVLDVYKYELASDMFTNLGNHQIALRVDKGRDKLVDVKAKIISEELPYGVETAHEHFKNAIDFHIEAARKFQEGVEFSSVSTLKEAESYHSKASDEQALAWKLLGM